MVQLKHVLQTKIRHCLLQVTVIFLLCDENSKVIPIICK